MPSLAMAETAEMSWTAETDMPCPNEIAAVSMSAQRLGGISRPAVSAGLSIPVRSPKPKLRSVWYSFSGPTFSPILAAPMLLENLMMSCSESTP
jgi:hypothetical protein